MTGLLVDWETEKLIDRALGNTMIGIVGKRILCEWETTSLYDRVFGWPASENAGRADVLLNIVYCVEKVKWLGI